MQKTDASQREVFTLEYIRNFYFKLYNMYMRFSHQQIILALSLLPGVGRRTLNRFLVPYRKILTNGYIQIDTLHWLVNQLTMINTRIKPVDEVTLKNALYKAGRILEKQESMGITAISLYDYLYPENFKALGSDAPVLFFAKGNGMLLRKPCRFIAVIGSRKISDYAAGVGTRLAHILADKEYVIVGGLAVGSDTCGHRGAMEMGYTIAVMPCGLDMVVPSENIGLFLQMIDNGSLAISEYPIGHAPTKASYVERDRLQAGIADGLIVLETSENGGTMHAVKKAAELQRPIGCLSPDMVEQPGNQMLIDQYGAVAINTQDDIDAFVKSLPKREHSIKGSILVEQSKLF